MPRARASSLAPSRQRAGMILAVTKNRNQICPTWRKTREPYISDALAFAVAPCRKPQPGRAPGSFFVDGPRWGALVT